MKILHICLANFYIDNHSYQENILTKYHKKLGHEVEIIASLVSFDENGNTCLLDKGSSYINEHGIPITRLEYKKNLTSKRLRKYLGTYKAISKANPDIIFIHGCQFVDIKEVVNYLKENPNITVYVDNHADFVNSAKNWLSKNILHKIIWKKCAHIIEPYTKKFYGVLPARVDFLKKVYKLPEEKIELLLMGADDERVLEVKKNNSRDEIRKKHSIEPNDFLIITGGKINETKRQTLLLMEAVHQINRENVKLIVFGSVIEELKEAVIELADDSNVKYIGWINSEKSYDYFIASDLVVFPGSHSVLWEQAVGQGIPVMVKYWKGITHIDLTGNCIFLYDDSIAEMKEKIEYLVNNSNLYNDMKKNAEEKGLKNFSYLNIAKDSIIQNK